MVGDDDKAARVNVMQAVRGHFRPEFLNRLDEIIIFHRLTRGNMDRIVDIQIGRLQALLADRKITIHLDAKAKEWLASAGYDPVYGARPLKRVIQRRLQDPLAQLLLEGRIGDGADVKVSTNKVGLTIDGQSFDVGEDVFAPEPPSHAIH
jgi:ATP-dependent Clp protease ATP-binding subunit ClpB